MVLRDELAIGVEGALRDIGKVDKAVSKALKATLTLETTDAKAKAEKLRNQVKEMFSKNLTLGISTTEASDKLRKLDSLVKDIRKRISSELQFNLGTSQASAKLQKLERLAKAVNSNVKGSTAVVTEATAPTTPEAQAAATRNAAAQQQELNAATLRFAEAETAASVAAEALTGSMRLQIAAAGLLGVEMKTIATQVGLFDRSVANVTQNGFGVSDKQLFKVNQSLSKFKAGLSDAGSEAERTRRQLSILGKESQSINGQLLGAGRALSLAFTLPTAVIAGFAAFKEFQFQDTIQRTKVLTDAFIDFDRAGKRVALTSEQVVTRIGALRGIFNAIASQTGQTPQDIAEGFYFVASAGTVAAERLSVLRVAAQGAAIGLGTVSVVADAVTSVLNAYGEAAITAAQAGDILVQSVNVAKVEAAQLAPQFGRVLPIAALLKVNFAQVATSLALLTRTGNDAGTAATQLRGIFQSLVRPTSKEAATILASVGLSVGRLKELIAQPTPTAFIDTLDALRHDSGLSDEQLAKLFRRIDAFNGFLTLTNQTQDQRQAFLDMADAAKNTTGQLDEFTRFQQGNTVLKIKQAFSDLLIQLEPIGERVLPLVASGVGLVGRAFSEVLELLGSGGGKIAFAGIAIAALSGPLLTLLGRVRQIASSFTDVQRVLSVRGGFGQFISGRKSIDEITAGAGAATAQTTLLGKAFGSLPGFIGVGVAAAGAFFAGSALGAKDTASQILGLAGTIGTMVLAYKAAQAAATSFGLANEAALGIVGLAAAALVGTISIFRAYDEAAHRSQRALDGFKHSLDGLTANEAVQAFPAALQKALGGITGDDRITNIEIPELQDALKGLGISYDEVAKKLASEVLLHPNDLKAQALGIRDLGNEIGDALGSGRAKAATNSLAQINTQLSVFVKNLKERGVPNNFIFEGTIDKGQLDDTIDKLSGLVHVSDESKDALEALASKGFLQFRNGVLSIPTERLAAAGKLLQTQFGADTTSLLNQLADAFRNDQKAMIQATGSFTVATTAAGTFVDTVDEGGNIVENFQSTIDDLDVSLSSLQGTFSGLIDKVFGSLNDTTKTGFVRNGKLLGEQLKKDIESALQPQDDGSGNKVPGIDFKVKLTSPEGSDAADFIIQQIHKIDDNLSGFFKGPDADFTFGLQVRNLQIQDLANQLGLSIDQVNALLTQEGLSTIDVQTKLNEQDAASVKNQLDTIQRLLDESPLDIPAKLKVADDKTGQVFGSLLLGNALTNGKAFVDFVIRAESEGTPLETLQAIFASADAQTVSNIIINAQAEGVPLDDISKAIAALSPEIRSNIHVNVDFIIDEGKAETNRELRRLIGPAAGQDTHTNQFTINAVVEGADAFEGLSSSVEDGGTYNIDAFPITNKFDSLVQQVAAGATWKILVDVDPTAFDRLLAELEQGVHVLQNLGAEQHREDARLSNTERGSLWSGGGFQRFAKGGLGTPVDGSGMARVPMIARAPRHRSGILWGEPQTHGEGYIPYNPVHRGRAISVMRQIASDFGLQLLDPNKMHTVRRFAEGAVVARPSGGGGDNRRVGDLAAEVARLTTLIASRGDMPPLNVTAVTQAADPRAAGKYVASEVAKVLQGLGRR